MLAALIISTAILLVLAIATWLLTRRAEREFPPAGSLLEAGGLRQHVLMRGNGPDALVMIHGAYGAAGDFAASLMPALADRYRCIAVDRPGQGYTARGGKDAASPAGQARHLHAVLLQLGIRRPLLLGFSFGGAVALAYALEFPGAAVGLVLVSPASHPWHDRRELPFGLLDLPLVGVLLRHTIVTPLGFLLKDRVVAGLFAPEPIPAAFAEVPVTLALRPDSYAANAADIRKLNGFLRRQAARYANLTLPVEIVAARDDRSVSTAIHAEQLVHDIPGAHLTLAETGGHLPHFTRPALVLQAIDRAAARAGLNLPQSPAASAG